LVWLVVFYIFLVPLPLVQLPLVPLPLVPLPLPSVWRAQPNFKEKYYNKNSVLYVMTGVNN
jgi:hypothetical protein